MSVRLRRLKADYDRIRAAFRDDSRIRLLNTMGEPPEKYQFEFLVPSLQMSPGTKEVRQHNHFTVEVTLTGSYPRTAPQCRMLTPVFHPNIAPHAICIGDHWAAGESLSHLIARIGEMLVFQSYNVKSPLNGEAARWVEKNRDSLPLDDFDFGSLLARGEVTGRNEDGSLRDGAACSNCGCEDASSLQLCINGHVTCPDCATTCPECEGLVCLACSMHTCTACGRRVCAGCFRKCPACDKAVCKTHAASCCVCGVDHCEDCVIGCAVCGQMACVAHAMRAELNGEDVYACHDCLREAGAIG